MRAHSENTMPPSRIAGAFILLTFLAAGSAAAAPGQINQVDQVTQIGDGGQIAAATFDSPVAVAMVVAEVVKTPAPPRRGTLLLSLYVSLAGLNAYDAYSTTKGYSAGATETNSLLRAAASRPAVVWAIKGGITAGSIIVAERLWRTHHRVHAIGMMVLTNSLMAVVAARNSSVLRNQQ